MKNGIARARISKLFILFLILEAIAVGILRLYQFFNIETNLLAGELTWFLFMIVFVSIMNIIICTGIYYHLLNLSLREESDKLRHYSEENLRKIIENAPFPLTITTIENGTLRLASHFVYGMYELDPQKDKNFRFVDLYVYPSDREKLIDLIEKNSMATDFEVKMRARSGRIFWVVISARKILFQGEPCILATQFDITQRRDMEEKIKMSEELYRTVISTSPDGITITDLAGNVTFDSLAAVKMFGFDSPDEVMGTNIVNYLVPEDRGLAQEQFLDMVQGGRFGIAEYRAIKKDGTHFYIAINGQILEDSQGNAFGAFFTVRDVSPLKQAEKELSETRLMLERAFEQTPIPMVLVSAPDGVLRIVNSACREFLEIDQKINPVGMRLMDLGETRSWIDLDIDGKEVPLEQIPLALALLGKRVNNQEMSIRTEKGTRRWELVNSSPIYNQEGIMIAAFVAFADISERKRMEVELRESEEKYRRVLESMQDVVWYYDIVQSRFTYISPSVEKLRGFTVEEALAQKMEETMTPESYETVIKMMTDRFDEYYAGTNKNLVTTMAEVEQRCKDGSTVWVEVATSFMANEAGELVGVFGVSRNITMRKKIEGELMNAKEAAESANRAKSVFLANMSHEIRTPLNAILGYAQLMGRDARLPSSLSENLSTIQRSGEHLLTLLNDVLDMSKIEAGHMTLQTHVFDLHRLLATVYELFLPKAKEKGLLITLEKDENLPRFVEGDDGRIRQVLINLVGNALKFTSVGKVVIIANCKNLSGMEGIQIDIEDTGIGISPVEQENIFSPFTQAGKDQNSQEGTGLGLALSRQYVRMMNGEIILESEEGVGSRFKVFLPLKETHGGKIRAAAEENVYQVLKEGQKVRRILVVDDRETNRTPLVALLESFNPGDSPAVLEVDSAADGLQALEMWERWKPDLLFLDMRMPGMTGQEVTSELRRRMGISNQANSIIIALSASTLEQDRQEYLECGCDDFVKKPFRVGVIIGVLKNYLALEFTTIDGMGQKNDRIGKTVSAFSLAEFLVSAPENLVVQLRMAANLGDFDMILEYIPEFEKINHVLAEELKKLTENFEQGILLQACNIVLEK